MLQKLSDDQYPELIKALYAHASVLAAFLPDLFDGYSVEDVVQETLLDYLQGRVSFDPTRGTLTAFLKTVLKNRVRDHLRRGGKTSPLEGNPQMGPKDNSPPERARDKRIEKLASEIRKLGQEDEEIAVLLGAIDELDEVPGNVDQVIAASAKKPVVWVRNIKRRIKYAFGSSVLPLEALNEVKRD